MLLTVNLGKICRFLADFGAKYAPTGLFAAEKIFFTISQFLYAILAIFCYFWPLCTIL